MDADLQLPLDLNKIFSKLEAKKDQQIGSQNVVVVSGQRQGQAAIEMFFDEQSGLLVRIVRYAQSPLGLNPTQIDYSDCRDVGGVKRPFHWTSATPTGRFSIQIESAQANVAIPESRFEKPQQ
jgi:hypothetical protein